MMEDGLDIDLDAPVKMTKRETLEDARAHLDEVFAYCRNLGLQPDKHIREAHRLLELALRE